MAIWIVFESFLRKSQGCFTQLGIGAGGDWETALGAAAHMGRKGHRPLSSRAGGAIDLFTAAMLGKLNLVQAILTESPELKQSRGPHGIPLINHAEAGGADAADVLALLRGIVK